MTPVCCLAAGWASEHAHARADAAGCVAPQIPVRPTEPLRASPRHRRVLARQLRRDLGDGQRLLDTFEERSHRIDVDALEAVLAPPPLEHRRRGPEARARVDQGRSAETAAERQRDRRVAERQRLPAVPVEPREHLRRARAERARVVVGTLLEQHHVQPALRQLGGRDRAAGPGADDACVGAECAPAGHRRPSRAALPRATTAAASHPSRRATDGSSYRTSASIPAAA